MPRPRPADRLDDLVRAATEVFIAQGYRRTQMTDIARELGVAKGTVYLYVESKRALFDLVLRHADCPERVVAPAELPVVTPAQADTVRFVAERLETRGRLPKLEAAASRPCTGDVEAELEGVVAELYDVLRDNRTGIKLLDRCALDFPELASLFNQVSRDGIPGLLERYIHARSKRGQFQPFDDPVVAARMLMELCVTWAVHMHWDPRPVQYTAEAVRRTVIRFAKGALIA